MIQFTKKAWEQYTYWQKTDPIKCKHINTLIKECMRSPFTGIGKPEALKGELVGCWSRRIDREHRLIYQYEEGILKIVACRFHYDK